MNRIDALEQKVESALDQMQADFKATMTALETQKQATVTALETQMKVVIAALDEQSNILRAHQHTTEKTVREILDAVKAAIQEHEALEVRVKRIEDHLGFSPAA